MLCRDLNLKLIPKYIDVLLQDGVDSVFGKCKALVYCSSLTSNAEVTCSDFQNQNQTAVGVFVQ